MITLSTELVRIRGLSANFLGKLKKLGIITVKDLLWHFPSRYDDFSQVAKIADLKINQVATVGGLIKKIESRRSWKRRMPIVEALITDETGGIKAVWFNQPYIAKVLKPGNYVSFAGKVSAGNGAIYLSNPAYENLHGIRETRHTGGLIPVYPETRGLTSRGLRYLIKPILQVLPRLPDFVPEKILSQARLPEINTALRKIHFPETLADAGLAKKRFAFQDLFLLQLNNMRLRSRLAQEKSQPIKFSEKDLSELLAALPYELTASQLRSLKEILSDISQDKPMNRLLQGDVGSGKTAVAAIAAFLSAKSGSQSVFMAPTEVLARQHYETLKSLFQLILERWGIKVGLLISALDKKSKDQILGEIRDGAAKIIIGTHAVIQKGVNFHSLNFIVVDEQHRFGVEQRAALTRHGKIRTDTNIENNKQKSMLLPHFLSMSATPIPRTLSLTLFGDLDLSIIDELPKGRQPIVTKVVAPENRSRAYAFVREQIKKGRQAFVICPRIESTNQHEYPANNTNISEISGHIRANLWSEVKAVKEEFERLSKQVFPDLRLAMLHGKIKSSEKERIMSGFKNGNLDILVSTSVIEVGVDVPNASIMVIEGAECFGLSQLYQFRGRIGRGEHQSFCLLFTESGSQSTQERLNALLKAKNGFELAELDLAMRGPGEFLGSKQTGIPDLAMNALNNLDLIREARDCASMIIKEDTEFSNYPLLKERLSEFQKATHLE